MESFDCTSSTPMLVSSKSLQQIVDNFEKLTQLFQDSESLKIFLIRFPFEELLKFSIVDLVTLKYCIELIRFLSEYEEFYANETSVGHCLELMLITLSSFQENTNEVAETLELLLAIITKLSNYKILVDSHRLLEIIFNLMRINRFDSSIAEYCCKILSYIIVICDIIPEKINEFLPQLFGRFKEINAIAPICRVCKLLLQHKDFVIDDFGPVLDWLVEESPLILADDNCDQTTNLHIIECLGILEKHYKLSEILDNNKFEISPKIERLLANLMKVSSNLCLLATLPTVRYGCCKLLELILKYFFKQENLPIEDISIADKLIELSERVNEWPQFNNLWFFPICHVVKLHSRFLWKNDDVISSISRCFYEKRNQLNIHTLKAIYFLYPILNRELTDINTMILGLDLLQFFQNYSEIPQIYSYNQEQLQWILLKGTNRLKSATLRKWLITNFDEKQLIKTIKKCGAQDVLLQILYDHFEEPSGIVAANLISKMKDSTLSNRITLALPLSINKPNILNILILSRPGISLDSKYLLMMCTLMGAVIMNLNEQNVLKGACIFTIRLLLQLRHQPEAVREFCRNLTNIRYLFEISAKVDDDVAVEIIKLMQLLVELQKQNQLQFDDCLYEDFEVFFKNSPSLKKIIRATKLIYTTILYKYSLIRMQQSCIFTIYQRLLDLTFNPELTKLSYNCLCVLLQRENWLALCLYTNLHIEIRCASIANFENVQHFIQMLYWWLLILHRQSLGSYLPVSVRTIRSFITRSPQIPKSKLQINDIYLLLSLIADKQLN